MFRYPARCSPRCAPRRGPGDRRADGGVPRPGCRRVRHRRGGGRVPAPRHLDAFEYLRGESMHITIHAGEAFGLPSIHEAVAFCGCERLGHGVRIVDDIVVRSDGEVALGRLAGYVRDLRIRSSCARPPTCRPAPHRRSPSTRSGCCPVSGSA